ncbi:hypothetical protein ACIO3O_42140 [Streptomyces sp. NPDC087440]|uniref:hypothetical protein n=1 Tax=Streptomyces sp. NPDC087440 TaxID=3365790 RepID=UPI00380D3ABD
MTRRRRTEQRAPDTAAARRASTVAAASDTADQAHVRDAGDFGKQQVGAGFAFAAWSGGIASYAADTITSDAQGRKLVHSFAAVYQGAG